VKKSELEILLSKCPGFEAPDASLEQYQTPAWLAAEVLNTAFLRGDIAGRTVMDLGCGTGMFSVGAALLGAKRVIGVEIDERQIELARGWANEASVRVEFVHGNVEAVKLRVDTVFSNPPFGVQSPHADRRFILFAEKWARVSYMLHYGPTEGFVREYVRELGGEVLAVQRYKCALPHGYPFHRKESKTIEMVLVISKGGVKID